MEIKAKTYLNSTLSPAISGLPSESLSLGLTKNNPVLIFWRMYVSLIMSLSYILPGRSLTAVWTSPDNCTSKQAMTLTSKPNWTKSFNSNALMFNPPGSPKTVVVSFTSLNPMMPSFNSRNSPLKWIDASVASRHSHHVGLEIAINGISGYPQAKMMISRYLQKHRQ